MNVDFCLFLSLLSTHSASLALPVSIRNTLAFFLGYFLSPSHNSYFRLALSNAFTNALPTLSLSIFRVTRS